MSASEESSAADVRAVLADLGEEIAGEGVEARVHDDDSNMTPMLVVTFSRGADRSGGLRTLFQAEGPVAVDSIYDRKVVVREARD